MLEKLAKDPSESGQFPNFSRRLQCVIRDNQWADFAKYADCPGLILVFTLFGYPIRALWVALYWLPKPPILASAKNHFAHGVSLEWIVHAYDASTPPQARTKAKEANRTRFCFVADKCSQLASSQIRLPQALRSSRFALACHTLL